MSKTPTERYLPGILPNTAEGLIQFFYDELPRIATALNAFPVGLNVEQAEAAVPIGTTPVEFRLFEGATPSLDLPGGGWNAVTGEWTVPLSGIYQLNANVVIGAFGAGQFDYGATLRVYADDVVFFLNSDAGQDDFDLSCVLPISAFVARDTVLRWTIGIGHQQQTGTVPVVATVGVTSTAQE